MSIFTSLSSPLCRCLSQYFTRCSQGYRTKAFHILLQTSLRLVSVCSSPALKTIHNSTLPLDILGCTHSTSPYRSGGNNIVSFSHPDLTQSGVCVLHPVPQNYDFILPSTSHVCPPITPPTHNRGNNNTFHWHSGLANCLSSVLPVFSHFPEVLRRLCSYFRYLARSR